MLKIFDSDWKREKYNLVVKQRPPSPDAKVANFICFVLQQQWQS